MKPIIRIYILASLILIGLLLWELWPQPIIEMNLVYDPVNILIDPLGECENLAEFLNGSWKISYPKVIERRDQAKVVLLFQPPSNMDTNAVSAQCAIVIETFLDLPEHTVTPASQFITPYFNPEPIQFFWIIEPHVKKEIDGVLWVYVNATLANDQSNRIPMFALPINIESVSIFSIPPRTIRVGILLCAMLILMILMTKNRTKPQ